MAIVVFAVAAAFLVPALIDQVQQLVEATPEMFAAAQTYLSERFPSLVAKDSNLWRSLASMQETLQSSGVAALGLARYWSTSSTRSTCFVLSAVKSARYKPWQPSEIATSSSTTPQRFS